MSDATTEAARAADPAAEPTTATTEVSKDTNDKSGATENANGSSEQTEKKERKGIISDASVLTPSDDPKEIKKQVEFYFSDSNLRFDKFMYSLVGKENKWVEIKIICSFNRMKRFNEAAVAAALEDSELLMLDEDKEKVKRRVPLQAPSGENKVVDRAIDRSLYMRGFGREGKSSQFDIEKYFDKTGIAINAVRLRRDDDKVFKGSVFVEFKQAAGLQLWMDLKDKPDFDGKKPTLLTVEEERADTRTEFSGSTDEKADKDAEGGLRYMTKKTFVDMKAEDIKSGKIKASQSTYKKEKFDAFAAERKDNKHHRGKGDSRPDLRNEPWTRGQEVKDGNRGGNRGGHRGGRNDRDRNNRGGRDNRDRNGRRDGGNRGGRGGDRGSRRGSDGKKNDGPAAPKVDQKGIPIVRTLSRSPSPTQNPRFINDGGESAKSRTPKRAREDDSVADKSPKKSKTSADGEVSPVENRSNGAQKRQRGDDAPEANTTAAPPSPKKVKA